MKKIEKKLNKECIAHETQFYLMNTNGSVSLVDITYKNEQRNSQKNEKNYHSLEIY